MLFKVLLFLPLLFNNAENKRISVTKIPGKWQIGESVKIEGISYSDTYLTINLQEGSDSENVDVGFHLSLRPGLRHVVLASIQKDNKWRKGAKVESDDFPLKASGCKMPFQVEIKAAQDQYEVSVNDHKYTFPYQTGLDHLTHLMVEPSTGGVGMVSHIDWSMNEDNGARCSAKTEKSDDDLSNYLSYNNQCEPKVITVSEIPGKWQIGESLKIQGTLSENFASFNINLQKGSNLQGSDAGVLISVKLASKEVKLVLGSIKDKKLIDPEVHDKDLPIDVTTGCKVPFEIEIKAVEDQFEISINNQKYTVPTQFQIDSLTHVLIGGDVSIASLDWSIDKDNEDLCPKEKPTSKPMGHHSYSRRRNGGYGY